MIEQLKTGASAELATKVRSDHHCEIGQWFHGEGASLYDDVPEFLEAREAHLKFHQAVARTIGEDGKLGADEELAVMLRAFTALNDKIGHLE